MSKSISGGEKNLRHLGNPVETRPASEAFTRFRFSILAENEAGKLLLHSLDEHATARIEDGLRVYELDLPEPSLKALFAAPISRLFKLVAEGVQAVFGSSQFRSARRDVGPSPAARVPLLPDRDR